MEPCPQGWAIGEYPGGDLEVIIGRRWRSVGAWAQVPAANPTPPLPQPSIMFRQMALSATRTDTPPGIAQERPRVIRGIVGVTGGSCLAVLRHD